MQIKKIIFIFIITYTVFSIINFQALTMSPSPIDMVLETQSLESRSFSITDFNLIEGLVDAGSIENTVSKDGLYHQFSEQDLGSGYGLNISYLIKLDPFTKIDNLKLEFYYINQIGFIDFIHIFFYNNTSKAFSLLRTDNTNGGHWENISINDLSGVFNQEDEIKIVISDTDKTDPIQNQFLIDYINLIVIGTFPHTHNDPIDLQAFLLLLFPILLIIIIISICLIMGMFFRRYKRREKLLNYLKQSQQRVGAEAMERAILMIKLSGSVISDIHFKSNTKGDEILLGGFFTALSAFGEQHNGNLRYIDFQGFKALVITTELLRMVIFFQGQPEELLEVRILSFLEYYEKANRKALENFNGNVNGFDSFNLEFFNYIRK